MAGDGSSVGSLLIALRADYSDLKAELDKSKQRFDDFASSVRASGERAKQSFDKMAMSAETIKRSFGNVATGVLLMTGAFDKAGEAGQALSQALGAYLAGGPLAAGVSILSSGFKLLSDEISKSGRASEEAAKKHKAALDEIDKRTKATEDRLRALNDGLLRTRLKGLGVDLPGGVIEDERAAGIIRKQADAEEDRANTLRRLIELQSRYDALHNSTFRMRTDSTSSEENRLARESVARGRAELAELQRRIDVVRSSMSAEDRGLSGGEVSERIKALDEIAAKLRKEAEALEATADAATEAANATNDLTEATKKAADPMDDFWNAIEKFRNGEAGDAMEAWAKDVQKGKDEAAKVAEELRKIDEASQAQADAAEAIVRDYDLQRQATEALTDVERDRLEVTRKIDELLNSGRIGVDQAERVYAAMMGALKGARELKQLEDEQRKAKADAEKAERERKAAVERATGANQSIDDEIAGLRAVTDEQRKQLELQQRIAQLRKEGASEDRIAALISATAWRSAYDEAEKARQRSIEQWERFSSSISSLLSTTIVDGLMDGFENGFRNAQQILQNFASQALRQVTTSIVNQLLGSLGGGGGGGIFAGLFGGLLGGGGGASSLVGAIGGGSSSVGNIGGMLSGLLGGGSVGDCPG